MLLIVISTCFCAGPFKNESQAVKNGHFTETIKKLFPMRINRFDARDGEAHFRNFQTDPKVNIYVNSVYIHAQNLTNSEHLSKPFDRHCRD